MKKGIFILFAIISFGLTAKAQYNKDSTAHLAVRWKAQNVTAIEEAQGLRLLSAVNDRVCWGTVFDGSGSPTKDYMTTVVVTNDGGHSWYSADIVPNTGADFNKYGISSLCGINDSVAYASVYRSTAVQDAKSGVYKTIDRGQTWHHTAQPIFNNSTGFLKNIHFWNANEGVAMGDPVGGTFEVYWTANGGDSWTRVAEADFTDSAKPRLNEHGIITTRTDAGAGAGAGAIRTLFPEKDSIIGFITDQSKYIFSRDRGRTWDGFSYPFQHTMGDNTIFHSIALSSDTASVTEERILISQVKMTKPADVVTGVTMKVAYHTPENGWEVFTPTGYAAGLVFGFTAVPGRKDFFIFYGATNVGGDDIRKHWGIGSGRYRLNLFTGDMEFYLPYTDGSIDVSDASVYGFDQDSIPMDFHPANNNPSNDYTPEFQRQYLGASFVNPYCGWVGNYTFTDPIYGESIVNGVTKYYSIYNIDPTGVKGQESNFVLDSFNVVASGTNGTIVGSGRYAYNKQVVLTAIANGGYKFRSWESGGRIISQRNPLVIKVTKDTNIIANFVVDDETGTNDPAVTGNLLKIYPNPVIDKLKIETADTKIGVVQIFNSFGVKVFEQNFNNNTAAVISLQHLPRGIYMLKIENNAYKIIRE